MDSSGAEPDTISAEEDFAFRLLRLEDCSCSCSEAEAVVWTVTSATTDGDKADAEADVCADVGADVGAVAADADAVRDRVDALVDDDEVFADFRCCIF